MHASLTGTPCAVGEAEKILNIMWKKSTWIWLSINTTRPQSNAGRWSWSHHLMIGNNQFPLKVWSQLGLYCLKMYTAWIGKSSKRFWCHCKLDNLVFIVVPPSKIWTFVPRDNNPGFPVFIMWLGVDLIIDAKPAWYAVKLYSQETV